MLGTNGFRGASDVSMKSPGAGVITMDYGQPSLPVPLFPRSWASSGNRRTNIPGLWSAAIHARVEQVSATLQRRADRPTRTSHSRLPCVTLATLYGYYLVRQYSEYRHTISTRETS